MANFLDDQTNARRMAQVLASFDQRLKALERSTQASYTSIEGGAIDIYDTDGTLRGSVGVQPDGSVALVPVNSSPPPTPTAPAVESVLAGLLVGWDGQWADAYQTPTDFSLVQVHVGAAADFTPDVTTQVATITAPLGGTVTIAIEGYAPVWVRLVGQNTAAVTGPASTAVQGQARQAVSQDLIDGIVTEVKLAENAVTEAKIALQAVGSDKIKTGAVNELLLADDAVTAAKLAAGAVDSTALGNGAVLAEKIAANAVTQAKIAAGAVTELALANQAVTAAKVAAAAIDSTKLADAAVTAAKLGNAAVTSGKIAAQAVNINALTGALADTASQRWVDAMADPTAWTVAQTGTGASWTHLSDVADAPTGKTVGEARGFVRLRGNTLIPYDPDVLYRVALRVRATAQPTTPDVVYFGALGVGADGVALVNRDGANSASAHYYVGASAKPVATADGWVTMIGFLRGRAAAGASGSAGPNNDPRSPGQVHANVRFITPYVWLNYANQSSVAGTMQVDAVTVEALKTGVVDSVNLVAGSVTTAAIAADAVTATQIAANAVTASEIASGAVTTAKLAAGAVTANEIAAATITSGQLAANSITATQLAAGSVQTAALAADAVAAGKIAADAITARELAANSVTAAEISAGAVTAGALAAGSVTTDKLTVAGGANLLSDPSFEGAYSTALVAGDPYFSIDTAKGNGSAKSLKVNAVAGAVTTRSKRITTVPILAGDQLFLAFDYLTSSDYTATAVPKLYARWEDSTGATLGWGVAQPSTVVLGGTTWTRVAATVTAPAGAVQASIWAESFQASAGTLWFDNAAVRPVVAGVQIADGAITTPKMVAGSIQGDRIAVGSLNADRIVSGSITTSQLNVTTAASIAQKFYDPGADAAKWRTGGTSTTTSTTPTNLTSVQVPDAQSGGYVMRAVGGVTSAWRPDVLIPFDPNVLYRISITVRQTVAGSDTAQQRFYAGVAGVAADGTTLVNSTGAASASSQHYITANAQNLVAGSGWQRFTGYLKGYAAAGATGTSSMCPSPTSPGVLHANARYITPFFYANYQNGTGTAEIGMVTVEVVETGAVQTVNIADGAITANKLLTNSVTTDKLVALGVTAEKIASLAITTDKLAALAVTADKLAANSVTATAILAGTIDATHIKAGSLTADRLALGTDGNLIPDPSFEGAVTTQRITGFPAYTVVAGGNGTAKALRQDATANSELPLVGPIPAMPGQKIFLAADYQASSDWVGTRVLIYAEWRDASGTALAWSDITSTDNGATTAKGTWARISGIGPVVAPPNTAQVVVRLKSYQSTAGSVLWDNVVARFVTASGYSGARAELSPLGLQLFDDSGEEAVALLTGRPNYLTLSNAGTPVATIDQNGNAGFGDVAVAGTLTVGGAPIEEHLTLGARGLIAVDYQATGVTASSTDYGFVELAFEAETSRMYRVVLDCYADPSVAGGELVLALKDGGDTTPTISSPTIQTAIYPMDGGGGWQRVRLETIRSGWSFGAGLHRLLITFRTQSGPSGQTVRLFGATGYPGVMYVEDVGPYIAETGVYNTGGGTATAPVRTYTKTYAAAWSGSYANRGSYNSYFGNSCYQGYYSSTNGMQASLIGFPASLATDLSGATIQKAEVYLYFDHWYSNAGGKAVIKAHKFASRPATFSCDPEAMTIDWGKNVGKWVDITSVFDSTTWRGIALDPNNSSSTYYGRARGYGQTYPPQLKVTYTK